ncbi:MAG: hypothetical protein SF029_09375 [bacterium]|nr:hypothetical protein [bacterium]
MSYFNQDHHFALLSVQANGLGSETSLQAAYRRLLDLHTSLYPKLRKHGFDLSTEVFPNTTTPLTSIANPNDPETLMFGFSRTRSQALTVEGMMGREGDVELRRHPIIELRLTPTHFVVELVVSPFAWYDQQNFAGKMTFEQHRTALVKLLGKMNQPYHLGFWSGTQLSEMHLTTGQLPPARLVSEWLSTFAAGRDHFRIGRWYEVEDAALTEQNALHEVFDRVRDLYNVYEFVAWTSNNNFHSFYARRMAARA